LIKKETFSSIFLIGFPLLLSSIGRFLYQIIDTAMLGHYDGIGYELAAIGPATDFTWILYTLLWPLGAGVQALMTRRVGRSEDDPDYDPGLIGAVLDNAVVAMLYAAAISLALSFLAGPIFNNAIKTEAIKPLAFQYINIIRIGLFPFTLHILFMSMFSSMKKTLHVMLSSLISYASNILINYVLIYGKFGMPELGIRGAALGTVISQLIGIIYLLLAAYKLGYIKKYHIFTFKHLNPVTQKDIIAVGLPPGIQNFIAISIFMAYKLIIEKYDPIFLAATHVTFQYFRLNKTIIGGFARGAAILVGNAFGRKKREEAWEITTHAGILAFLNAILIGAFSFTFARLIGSFFSSDPEIILATERAIRFLVFFFFIEAIGYNFEMIFIPNGYGKWVLVSEFTNNVLFILLGTLLMRFFFPDMVWLAWLSFGFYQIGHALLLIFGFFRRKWLYVEVDKAEAQASI
jgi:MATE family multidrug resistance protein